MTIAQLGGPAGFFPYLVGMFHSATSRILFWTVSSFGLLSYFLIALSLSSLLLQWLLNDLLEMVEIEDLALSNRPTEDG